MLVNALSRWLVVATALSGCRFNFDPLDDDAGVIDAPDAPVGLGALPAYPGNICKVDRYPVPVPALADLVIAGTDDGFTAIWVDTQTSAPAQALLLGPDHHQIAAPRVPLLTDTRLGGAMDLGDVLMTASATGSVQTISAFTPDLTMRSTHLVGVGPLMARDPFAYEATRATVAVVVGSNDHTLDTRYAAPSGEVRAPGPNNIVPELLEISCGLGPGVTGQQRGHGHCAWTERGTAPAQIDCRIADISFDLPTFPKVGSNGVFATDCHDLRAVSGPPGNDALMVVWRTEVGRIRASFFKNTPVTADIAERGSAPRVTFDDNRFWIAWLDPAGELAVRSLDPLDASGTSYPMPGWTPRGPEAFELVRRGDETLLAVLRDDELDLLTLCR